MSDSTVTYAPTIRNLLPYAHYNGTLYSTATDVIPDGAFYLYENEYLAIKHEIEDGGVLKWHAANQLPYVEKDVLESWTRPNVTSETSHGTITTSSEYSSSYAAWMAFDGSTSTNYASNGAATHWINWQLKDTIILKKVTFTQRSDSTEAISPFAIYTDSTKTTAIVPSQSLNTGKGVSTEIDLSSNTIASNNLYMHFTRSSGTNSGACDIALSGYRQVTKVVYEVPRGEVEFPYAHYNGKFYVVGDDVIPDGAFYLYPSEYKSLQSSISSGGTLKWYDNQRPYVEGWVKWNQPVMTSNKAPDGTTTWAEINNGSAYCPLNGASGAWFARKEANGYTRWKITFPYELRITKVTFYSRADGSNNYNTEGQWYDASGRAIAYTKSSSHNQLVTVYNNSTTPLVTNGLIFDKRSYSNAYSDQRAGTYFSGFHDFNVVATYFSRMYEVPDRTNTPNIQVFHKYILNQYSLLVLQDHKRYSIVVQPQRPYAHCDGIFYGVSDAPERSYLLTEKEYQRLQKEISNGGTLYWYDDQRPYVEKLVSWTSPVFSSATASDGSVISSGMTYDTQAPWMAMDGIVPDASNGSSEWGSRTKGVTWWQVKFPYTLRVTGITVYNGYTTNVENANLAGRFYTDQSKLVPIGDAINTPQTVSTKTVISNVKPTDTDTLYFYKTETAGSALMGEVVITAKKLVSKYEVPLR